MVWQKHYKSMQICLKGVFCLDRKADRPSDAKSTGPGSSSGTSWQHISHSFKLHWKVSTGHDKILERLESIIEYYYCVIKVGN